jgi:acyl-CoA reductase-like NAD-dependent aldehyde dehydrogenase
LADEQTIKEAIAQGVKAEEPMKQLASYQRKDILHNIANQVSKKSLF